MHLRRAVAIAVALTCAPLPAQAQDRAPAPAAEADLQCAAWAAIALGLNSDKPDAAQAYSMALSWYLARYEGATGKTFEEALTADYINSLQSQLQAIEDRCLPQMQAIGQRLSAWGENLSNSDTSAAQPSSQ